MEAVTSALHEGALGNERENRELRMKNDFLSKAAAYFAAEHR